MELNVEEETKNKIIFTIKEDHSFLGALKKELWNDDKVKVSGYHIDHPLVGTPKFTLETSGADPRKTLVAAAKRIAKAANKVKADAKALK